MKVGKPPVPPPVPFGSGWGDRLDDLDDESAWMLARYDVMRALASDIQTPDPEAIAHHLRSHLCEALLQAYRSQGGWRVDRCFADELFALGLIAARELDLTSTGIAVRRILLRRAL